MGNEKEVHFDIQKNRLLTSFLKSYTGDISDPEIRDKMKGNLREVYKDGFRHQYSVVTGALIQCLKEGVLDSPPDSKLDTMLLKKLNVLRDNNDFYSDEFICAFKEEEYQKGVTKLMDHISLEIARLDFMTELYRPLMTQANDLSDITRFLFNQAKNLDRNIKETQEAIAQTKDGIDKQNTTLEQQNSVLEEQNASIKKQSAILQEQQQTIEQQKATISKQKAAIDKQKDEFDKQKFDFIAILGIFSGIVLAFVGGITFVNSTLQGIAQISKYRLIAMAIICGLVLVNSICLTLRYIEKLITQEFPKEFGWPLIIFDIIGVLLLIGVCCVYWFGAPGFLRAIWI